MYSQSALSFATSQNAPVRESNWERESIVGWMAKSCACALAARESADRPPIDVLHALRRSVVIRHERCVGVVVGPQLAVADADGVVRAHHIRAGSHSVETISSLIIADDLQRVFMRAADDGDDQVLSIRPGMVTGFRLVAETQLRSHR